MNVDERWIMDYTQFDNGFWMFVVIDCFSRRVWTTVFPTKQEKNVIKTLDTLFSSEHVPSIIQSDNGGVSFINFQIY